MTIICIGIYIQSYNRYINYCSVNRRSNIDYINGFDRIYSKQKIRMGNEECNNQSIRINSASIICDKNDKLDLKIVAEELFKLYSYEKNQTGLKRELKN